MDDMLSFKPKTMTGHTDLSLTISNLALLPIASKGLSYTWMNNRSEVEFVIEKLDRAFASLDWLEAFPHTLVRNLSILCSDYGSILLDTECRTPFLRRPFRFE